MLRAILIALLAAIVASPAVAASFNCKLAKLPVEIAICGDPTLSSEDEELARQYTPLLDAAPDAASLKAIKLEQQGWLKSRNACKADRQCIMGSYRERLQRFGDWREQFAASAAAQPAEAADAKAPTVDPNAPSIAPSPSDDKAPAGDPTGDAD